MDEKKFLVSKFREYYMNNKLVYTERLSQREIGFIPFDGKMIRHMNAENQQQLQMLISDFNPRHLYHSVAYYKYPDKRSMQEKQWTGAEYVFDLDADHIPGADKMPYEQILQDVKIHTMRLINKFLLGYLEIDPGSLSLYFSGARGYHVHIRNDAFYQMNSDQRREISNLVRGEGISAKSFISIISKNPVSGKGWIRDIDEKVKDAIRKIDAGERTEYLDIPAEIKVKALLDKRVSAKDRRPYVQLFNDNNTEIYNHANAPVIGEVLEKIIAAYLKSNAVEIDEPVSTDIHRLIRFPYSLHGKTGLMVKKIELDELKDFEPLNDAIPSSFGTDQVHARMKQPFQITFKGERYGLDGEVMVPTDLGIFLSLSGRANIY